MLPLTGEYTFTELIAFTDLWERTEMVIVSADWFAYAELLHFADSLQ